MAFGYSELTNRHKEDAEVKKMWWLVLMLVVSLFDLIEYSPASVSSAKEQVPDSKLVGKIAFIREGNIWIVEASGKSPRQLTASGDCLSPSWSPDGKCLVYERGFKNASAVWLIDVEKGAAKRLVHFATELGGAEPTFSSDGQYVIYIKRAPRYYHWSDPQHKYQKPEYLIAINLKTGKETILSKRVPGGEDIPYSSPQSIEGIKDIIFGWGGDGYSGLTRLRFGVEKNWLLGEEPDTALGNPSISPDRKYLAVCRGKELLVIRIRDKKIQAHRLPPKMDIYYHSFSPDGRYIITDACPEDQTISDIWILDLQSGNWRTLIKNGSQPVWSPR